MKKSVFYFIIFGIIFGFGGIMGVNADSTVLYNNGTLIINELTADRTTNVDKYGAVVEGYQAFDANTQNSYVFEKAEDVLEKVQKILDNNSYDEIAMKGRSYIENNDWEVIVNKFEKVLNNLIKSFN